MTTPVPHPRGGLYFEDFSVGQVFRHRLTRTVTQMDNMLFSNMTLNPDFASGALVFPGGRMEPADAELAASLGGGVDPLGPFKVAAIREAFEECGVLIARPRGEDGLVPAGRAAALDRAAPFAELMTREALLPALDLLVLTLSRSDERLVRAKDVPRADAKVCRSSDSWATLRVAMTRTPILKAFSPNLTSPAQRK